MRPWTANPHKSGVSFRSGVVFEKRDRLGAVYLGAPKAEMENKSMTFLKDLCCRLAAGICGLYRHSREHQNTLTGLLVCAVRESCRPFARTVGSCAYHRFAARSLLRDSMWVYSDEAFAYYENPGYVTRFVEGYASRAFWQARNGRIKRLSKPVRRQKENE